MGGEQRFRDDRGVDGDELDWVTPAEALQIPLDQARALHEEALRRAMYPGSRPARDLYVEWLAAWEPEDLQCPPGRHALTMRLGQRHRREPARRSHVPGKCPLTAHLDRPRPRAAAARDGADRTEARPDGDAFARGLDLILGRDLGRPGEPDRGAPGEPGRSGTLRKGGVQDRRLRQRYEDARARGLGDMVGLLLEDRAETAADVLAACDDHLARAALSLVERDGVPARSRSALRRLRERVVDPRRDGAVRIAGVVGAALAQAAERHAVTLFRREAATGDAADPEHPAVAEALRRRGSGEPLPEPVRRDMEARLGADLRRVRVHTDAVAQRAAAAVQARAFTVGEDVFFAAGAFQPDSSGGSELLAHELAHVVQGHRGHLPATSGPHITAPGDAVEREADAMAHDAMRGPAGAATRAVAPHAGAAAAPLLIARDPDPTITTPAVWPPADDPVATAFWTAAQAAFGFAETETAEGQRVFNIFKTSVRAGGWTSVNANLALYGTIADAEGGRWAADHGALVPIFVRLLGLNPPISTYAADDAFPLLWTNARTARGWTTSDVEEIYRTAIHEPVASQLSIPRLATALGDEGDFFGVAQGFWSFKNEQVRVLPGFLHFKDAAPSEWRNAEGFRTFANPICNAPDIENVIDMVKPEIADRGWLTMPLNGTMFWSGGDTARDIATMMSGHEDTVTPIDSARARIDWRNPPRGGFTGTINNGALSALLGESPLWTMESPNDFSWGAGGKIFFQGISRVLATQARGLAHAVLVGAPSENAIFLDVEMPELIALKNRPLPVVTGLRFLCFPRTRTTGFLQHAQDGRESADLTTGDLLQPAPDGIPDAQKRNYGLETFVFSEAEAWMNMQSGNAALATRLAQLRVQWEAAGRAGAGPVIIIPFGEPGEPGATIDVTDGLPTHPGLQIEDVHLELTDEATVASGSITATIAAGELIQIPSVTYLLSPTTGEINAIASNSVADRTSGTSPFGGLLDGIPIDWDVHVVAGGLAVSLTLTDPVSLVGGLSIERAEGVLSYTGGDGLTGTISATITNGSTITGTVELGYQDGRYRIGGALEVTGLLEGLAPFQVEMDYGGPEDWRVGLAEGSSLSVSTQLLGVPVSGVIESLEMGSANRLSTATEGAPGSQTGFSASGSLTADLPLIGSVEAGIRIVNNQLDTVSLTAERGFSFPAGSPMVSGNVTGIATYHVQTGTLEGGLSGTANVTVPSIEQPVAITFALAAGPAGFTVDARLVGDVEINRFLCLTSLSATYEDGQLTFVGGAAVQNLGDATASIRVRIDQAGVHVEEGSATVTFGDASFGGEATFRYSETDGFGFDGDLDIQVLPGKSIRLSVAYPSQGEGGTAEDGTFDASVTIPPPEGGEGATSAGWELWAGVQPAAPAPLFSAPHISIPIFSIGLATATIEIDAALLYTLAVDPLTVAGSLAVEGINLADPQQPFRKITVTGTAQSGITGQLIFEPSVALGLSVVHPFLAGIRGGLQLPITATAGLDIQGNVALELTPGGGLSTEPATVTAPLSFSVVATPRLFAQLEALGGIIAPPAWQSDDLAELPLFEDKKLLEVVFDLAHPDRGITVNTFNPTAPASSSPTGMPMTPREPTMTAGSESAATLASNAAVSTTTSNATGTTSGGGMDFSALLTAVSGAMPQPVQDLISTLQALWGTIEPIVNQVIEFLSWISASIRSIFTDDEVQRLLTEVLPQLASGDLANIADAVRAVIEIGRSVVEKLVAPLIQLGDVAVMRRRTDRGIFGFDEFDPDEFSYRFHIPGLLDVSGQGSDPALSAMVVLLQNELGVPIRDLDDVQPPHMIGYFEHNNASGDTIGSSSDGAQTLRGGEQFHHDCMSSVKGYGVTAGTTLHLYEHSNSEGDYTRITFGTAPEPEPTIDENGLEQRKLPTITVNIGSGGDNASWAVIRGSQLNDKVSTIVITSGTAEPSR